MMVKPMKTLELHYPMIQFLITKRYLRLLCPLYQWSVELARKMAAEVEDLETSFLHSIPSLFRQAERNLHSDNLNVLEYFERRLDDHAYLIRSVILQCEQQSASEDLIQLLD